MTKQKHERYDENDLEAINHASMSMGNRLDEDGSIFLARELDYVKAQVYEVETLPLTGLQLFPVVNEIPAYAKTFTYQILDGVGMARIVSDYADDLPLVDVGMREETGKVYRIGNAYLYSIDEVNASIATGKNLPTRKATEARKAHDVKNNDMIFNGDANHQIVGLFDHPNIPHTVSAGWTTAAIAFAELSAAIASVTTTTGGLHNVTNIVIPPSVNLIMATNMPNTSISYRTYFNQENPGLTWQVSAEMEDWDGNGNRAVLLLERDASNAAIEIPEAFNQLPPQPKDLHYKIPCTSKSAGLIVYRPLTMNLITGV